MASKNNNTIHPTVDQKKVSVVTSQGHKLKIDPAADTVMQQAKKRLSGLANFCVTSVTDPFDSNHYKNFVTKLSLSKEEAATYEKIKKATDQNFADIYAFIPRIKDKNIQDLLISVVSMQQKYFTQLLNLDFEGETLDEQIEKISANYNKEFGTVIQKKISELEDEDTYNIDPLYRLTALNTNIIEAFKANVQDLQQARELTRESRNMYKRAVIATACTCLGTLLLSLGVVLSALVAPIAPLISKGLLYVTSTPFVISTYLFPTSTKTSSAQTEKYIEGRKDVFDKVQTNLYSTCLTLREFITANEPRLKAS